MRVIPVNNRQTERAFLELPRKLYRNDPNFVMPFDKEVKKAFSRKINPHFKQLELSWVGDFNPKMIALYEATGTYSMREYLSKGTWRRPWTSQNCLKLHNMKLIGIYLE